MFISIKTVLGFIAAATLVAAAPVEERATCNKYILISTRGSGQAQGQCPTLEPMIKTTLSSISGGVEYDTVYAASWDQNSAAGTTDIINKISTVLASCPSTKFGLLGYSQGAYATVDALKQISTTSTAGAAIKAVFLIGDPQHTPGKKSNIDNLGGTSNANAYGIEATSGSGIPSAWDASGKVTDLCYKGDGVCSGSSITIQHTYYQSDSKVQSIGSNFLISKLQ